ncbi:MAG: D-glycerate dehydrogenase, partial [Candidatus Aminicenantes bacterium]|nr:D-glycerate dehydrogenase [Candidatus Aminicenantes bacterium]
MKPKALVTRKIFPEVLAYLEEYAEIEGGRKAEGLTREALRTQIADKDGLLCLLVDRIDREIISAAPRLRIIANCAVGFDNIDLEAARERGILVTNTPGVLTEATADLTWALILAVARRIPQADRFAREKRFQGWELDLFLGREVSGRRLGIIGLGRIGREVAARARAFRMDVAYHDPKPLPDEEEKALVARYVPLDELLAGSDIISIHASLNPETRHLISAEKIRLMKKTAILINVARGPIVDEKALAEALTRGEIWGAGLDVYEREPEIEARLLGLDNVVLLPHIGSATFETRLNMAMAAARNLVQGL